MDARRIPAAPHLPSIQGRLRFGAPNPYGTLVPSPIKHLMLLYIGLAEAEVPEAGGVGRFCSHGA